MSGASASRPLRGAIPTLLTVAAAVAVSASIAFIASTQPRITDGPGALARGGGGADRLANANPEAAEQGEQTEARLQAYEAAVRAGTAGSAGRIRPLAPAAPAPGWAGERVL